MKPRGCFPPLAFAVLLCAVGNVRAQQPMNIPRIGYISGASNMGASEVGFQKGLKELGYIEGKNILVEYRYQEGNAERGPSLVAELIKVGVDVLVVIPSRAVRAAKQATKTIPIVIATTADPVATGLVESLARPGGNITGVTRLTRDLNGKRLELLKEVVATTPRIGVLYQSDSTSGDDHFKDYETAARGLKIQLHGLPIRAKNPEIEKAFHSAVKARVSGLLTVSNSLMRVNRTKIVNSATKHQLPSMFESNHWPQAGGSCLTQPMRRNNTVVLPYTWTKF